MRVTFSIEDQVVARARLLAQRRGTSLNQIIRDYIEMLVANDAAETAVVRLLKEP